MSSTDPSTPAHDDPPPPSGPAWIEQWAAELAIDAPDAATVDTLLELAGVAAHASERIAAPIACYLVGRAGLSPVDALALARRLAGDPPPE